MTIWKAIPGIVFMLTALSIRGDEPKAPSLTADLACLKGQWTQAKPSQTEEVMIEVKVMGETASLAIACIRKKGTELGKHRASITLVEDQGKRFIAYTKVDPPRRQVIKIGYKLEGDKLTLDGVYLPQLGNRIKLSGEWKRAGADK